MERLTLRDSFVNGLRNKPYVNSEYLTTCRAMRATEVGLLPFKEFSNEISEVEIPALTGDYGSQIDFVGKDILIFNGEGLHTTAGVDIPIYCADKYWTEAVVTSAADEEVFSGAVDALLTIQVKATNSGSVGDTVTILLDELTHKEIVLTADYQEYVMLVSIGESVEIHVTGDTSVTTNTQIANIIDRGEADFERITYTEFGDVWFACTRLDGNPIFLYHTPANGSVGAVAPLQWAVLCTSGYRSDETYRKTVGAATNHMGRLYLAGFNATDLQYQTTEAVSGSLSWEYFWNSYLENCEIELTHEDMAMGSTTVFYSKLNGGDYFWPFSVELAMLGLPHATAFEDAIPFLLDGVRKHELGFFDVPTNGTIYRLESLRDSLVIFATDGIFVATTQMTEAGMGHAVARITDIPAINRSAIFGIGRAVYAVNQNSRLNILAPDQGLIDVDFNILLRDMTASELRMEYDFELDDLYISDDSTCYVLTKTGMCEYGAAVYSFIHTGGTLVGYVGSQATGDGGGVLATICTETLDFAERMLKEVHSLEFGLTNATNIQTRILYKTNSRSGWQYTAWQDVYDIDNYNTPIVSGHDIRIEVRFELQGYDEDDYTKFEYLNLLWRRGDKRNFRLHRSQV